MAKIKYIKADLLWEATRRNEEYKEFYRQVSSQTSGETSKWERIWHPGNYRWKIQGLLHPSISVDDIREKIKAGSDPNEVHPYFYMFDGEHKAVVQLHIPKFQSDCLNEPIVHLNTIKIDSSEYKWFQQLKTIANDRILLSINPMATDKAIIKEIKKLKSSKRRLLKNELTALKTKGNPPARN